MGSNLRLACAAIFALSLTTFSSPASAFWSANPTANLPVILAPDHQTVPAICSDGADGAIIAWVDSRYGVSHVRVQRIKAGGDLAWAPDGIRLAQSTSNQGSPVILSDGAGGAIVSWVSSPGGQTNSYAQRVNGAGALLWGSNGLKVTNGAGPQSVIAMTSDGANGAILVGQSGSEATANIYAQRVSAAGVTQWAGDGTVIANQSGSQVIPRVVTDGAGGAIISWFDTRAVGGGVYAQRVNSLGTTQWTPVLVAPLSGEASVPVMVSDAAGGAIVAWHDGRNGNLDIFAQRLNSSGSPQWITNGVALCLAAGDQRDPIIETDGAFGAIVAWTDGRGPTSDVYARRISGLGSALWSNDGEPVCAAAGDQYLPTLTRDGAGGAIFCWTDHRSGTENDIYSQHLDASGIPTAAADGTALSTAAHDQSNQVSTFASGGGAIVAWEDSRSDLGFDLYAQHTSYIAGLCPGVATDFTATSTSGVVPFTVQFNGLTAGATQWAWDFDNDGVIDATDRNPTHVYSVPGLYSVSLVASDGRCSTGKLRASYINARATNETAPLWVTDPHVNLAIATTPGVQSTPSTCTDGNGGAYIAWVDDRTGYGNVRLQHLDARGAALLAAGGVPVVTRPFNMFNPVIAPDGRGGAIVAWWEVHNDTGDIFAQRIDASGQLRWTGAGSVCTANGLQRFPVILPDGFAGAFIAWEDTRLLNPTIFVQRMDSTGFNGWTNNGKGVSSGSPNQSSPALLSDGEDGVFVTWSDLRDDAGDVYAARFNRAGTLLWSDATVIKLPGRQGKPVMTKDGAGGAILVWEDDRGGGSDLFAQRIGPTGQRRWLENGIAVCQAAGVQSELSLFSDEQGGTILTWSDRRSGNSDIYVCTAHQLAGNESVDRPGSSGMHGGGRPISADFRSQRLQRGHHRVAGHAQRNRLVHAAAR